MCVVDKISVSLFGYDRESMLQVEDGWKVDFYLRKTWTQFWWNFSCEKVQKEARRRVFWLLERDCITKEGISSELWFWIEKLTYLCRQWMSTLIFEYETITVISWGKMVVIVTIRICCDADICGIVVDLLKLILV